MTVYTSCLYLFYDCLLLHVTLRTHKIRFLLLRTEWVYGGLHQKASLRRSMLQEVCIALSIIISKKKEGYLPGWFASLLFCYHPLYYHYLLHCINLQYGQKYLTHRRKNLVSCHISTVAWLTFRPLLMNTIFLPGVVDSIPEGDDFLWEVLFQCHMTNTLHIWKVYSC